MDWFPEWIVTAPLSKNRLAGFFEGVSPADVVSIRDIAPAAFLKQF
jgi:hypothetical protein